RITGLLDQFVDSPIPFTLDSFSAVLWRESGSPYAFNPYYSLPPPGTCTVYTANGNFLRDILLPGAAPSAKVLDGGSSLKLSGAATSAQILASGTPPQVYAAILGSSIPGGPAAPLFAPGSFSLSSAGGADVGAVQSTFTAKAPVTWTNE